ncbi:MAG TPA: hypothetical protein EYG11_05890 [Candidatus Latescibacteria bacterium]|nr:hypothetical protein [Candidatus Handelsmanbacteria bacterium]HIL08214.1 hypothetical protein [Candidatus Latescibacterota bacterium]
MDESTLLLAGLFALFLLISLVYAKKKPPTALLFDTRPVDFAVTIWTEQSTESVHEALDERLLPHRITAEYLMRIQANSAGSLEAAQREFARRASADFRQRFTPMLDESNLGAVLCQLANERE